MSANRDEFFSRPTAKAQFWDSNSNILAGQDLVGGGTWIGITRTGRFAAVTNVREPNVVVENPKTRGDLTRHFLAGEQSCEDYLRTIASQQTRYSGFNLLVGEFNEDRQALWYFSNRQPGIRSLDEGTYGLSNHLLNSEWPKVNAGKDDLQKKMDTALAPEDYHQQLRNFLENPSLANDNILPKTGVSYEREKALSAAHITLPDYGTRTSTVITISHGVTLFSEKNYVDANHQQLTDSDDYTLFELDNKPEAIPAIAAL
jgi:uncharacterized protein with NRDE domain